MGTDPNSLARAQGCLAGQLAGDSLGSLVEFQPADVIARRYPDGVRLLCDGGTWNTIAGQPTDDSELALALARSLVEKDRYEEEAVAVAYAAWYASAPFDVGNTIRAALSPAAARARAGHHVADVAATARRAANAGSQANGALMRVSPLGVFGARLDPDDLAAHAQTDALLTHPHEVCQAANVALTAAIAFAIRTGASASEIHRYALDVVQRKIPVDSLLASLRAAETRPPDDYQRQQGWVLIALQNAFYQLLHAPDLETGVVDTVMRGGDTDTNAAIAGALLGAAWGVATVPRQWIDCLCNCRPADATPGVHRPRPPQYWPTDALGLAGRLIGVDLPG